MSTDSGAPAVYTYVLVSGDFEEEGFDASEYDAMLDACSEMTVTGARTGPSPGRHPKTAGI